MDTDIRKVSKDESLPDANHIDDIRVVNEKTGKQEPDKPEKKRKKWFFGFFAGFVALIIGFCGVVFFTYKKDIIFSKPGSMVTFKVEKGDTVSSVADKLKKADLITSKISFEIYARLHQKTNLKTGSYDLSSSMTIPQIIDKINKGEIQKNISVMFVPGGTVAMAKKTLLAAGYTDNEINQAFDKDYSADFPRLFSGKPKKTDLEGFLYGETHTFQKNTSVEKIIRRFLSDFEQEVIRLNLEEKYKSRGLSLYEGITLASIVQKETLNDWDDKKMVSGVFFNRMKAGMTLGSDVTYQYIADKLGVERDYNLNSPYNLRVHKGLTPTPISTPGVSTLEAVATPASHNFLFFLSGDDDKTYFAKTDLEHQKNIQKYCQKKCKII